ncbi:hypothetical protein [Streptomyces stelliscabiei]|uniref:hypothetical protein n=1 Tax=Streptomyces stelliscabiei TaxID=146820 RepID=UPI0029B48FB5|nr:hypothetical protein [Streptomyces stelliscabiei]MDX2557648.1 hypothetical protein [Streptomyces stelliscabiei]MDX2617099.1 hypothetical protein [Streptomyces stelliscabiei]MDX2641473.1 hypothetical protein [Streptomyces stelliscabiei]MDX2666477.1 hypothetical protein [Streptomyces stelliscabiei]MDX2717326.1 hypothetical protein [Streptomyces stelliscabiei]
MPKKTITENPYGYDPETGTVRVGKHDLERLLLMFRSLVREQEPGSWDHMRDYDLSFERLADAVDAADQARQGSRWEGPDLRLRCTTTEAVYDWPDGAPYEGGTPVTWNVPGYGSHAADDDSGHLLKSLCGFSWAEGEGRVVNGLPDCRECLREVQLGAERPRGSW